MHCTISVTFVQYTVLTMLNCIYANSQLGEHQGEKHQG